MGRHTKKLLLAAGALVAVIATGVAVAATTGSRGEESEAIVDAAAKQLGVSSADLTKALKDAMKGRIDAAVSDGRLTQAQADRMNQRLDSADAPLFGLGRGHHGHGARGAKDMTAATEYLGLTAQQLFAELRSGKSLADVARAQGKSVDGLVDALVASTKAKIEQAVAAGRLTQEQAAAKTASLEERITALVNGERGMGKAKRFGGPAPSGIGA